MSRPPDEYILVDMRHQRYLIVGRYDRKEDLEVVSHVIHGYNNAKQVLDELRHSGKGLALMSDLTRYIML